MNMKKRTEIVATIPSGVAEFTRRNAAAMANGTRGKSWVIPDKKTKYSRKQNKKEIQQWS